MIFLDPQPLLDAIEARGGLPAIMGFGNLGWDDEGRTESYDAVPTHEWRRYKSLYRQLGRMQKGSRITVATADEWCIKVLGINPSLIFGDVWWESVGEPDEVAQAWLEGAA